MVEFKDKLANFQLLLVFLIPITPHIEIAESIQLDDIPVILFFFLFLINIYNQKINKLFFKETLPFIYFISYITIQNFLINGDLFFSDNIRYLFYLLIFVTILNYNPRKLINDLFLYLSVTLGIFSILFYTPTKSISICRPQT